MKELIVAGVVLGALYGLAALAYLHRVETLDTQEAACTARKGTLLSTPRGYICLHVNRVVM